MRRGAFAESAAGEIDAIAAGDVNEIDLALAAVGIDQHQLVGAGSEVGERMGLAAGDDARALFAQPVGAPGGLARRREVELVDRLAGGVDDLELGGKRARRAAERPKQQQKKAQCRHAISLSVPEIVAAAFRGRRPRLRKNRRWPRPRAADRARDRAGPRDRSARLRAWLP